MTYHTMVLSEPDAIHNGFVRRYFAIIDVSIVGTQWHWQQVDANGNRVGSLSDPFLTEDDAMDAALQAMNGDGWE
jgi:hypothetical protein